MSNHLVQVHSGWQSVVTGEEAVPEVHPWSVILVDAQELVIPGTELVLDTGMDVVLAVCAELITPVDDALSSEEVVLAFPVEVVLLWAVDVGVSLEVVLVWGMDVVLAVCTELVSPVDISRGVSPEVGFPAEVVSLWGVEVPLGVSLELVLRCVIEVALVWGMDVVLAV